MTRRRPAPAPPPRRRAGAPLLAALCLRLAAPTAAEAALRVAAAMPETPALTGLIGQPPTEAVDSLDCGYLLLPARVQLRTRPSSVFQREGVWESPDGATLISWVQQFFRLSPEKVYYSRNSDSLFEAEPTEWFEGEWRDTVVLRDCVGVPAYYFRARPGESYGFDIFDRSGHVVARSRFNSSAYFPKQLLFTDAEGDPLAVAESPTVMRPSSMGRTWRQEDDDLVGAVTIWEVMFYGVTHSSSPLVQAQHRWVIAAVVQTCALIDTAGSGAGTSGAVSACAWLLASLVPLAFAAALVEACRRNHALVYPAAKAEEGGNPFFRSVYGSVLVPRPRGAAGS